MTLTPEVLFQSWVASCHRDAKMSQHLRGPNRNNYIRVAMAVIILSHQYYDVIMFQGGFPKYRKDAAPKVRSDLGAWGFYFPIFRTTEPLRVMPGSLLLCVVVSLREVVHF